MRPGRAALPAPPSCAPARPAHRLCKNGFQGQRDLQVILRSVLPTWTPGSGGRGPSPGEAERTTNRVSPEPGDFEYLVP